MYPTLHLYFGRWHTMWAWGGGGKGGGIPPLKVKPYVVKYEFQNSLMNGVPPPEAQKRTFARPCMDGGIKNSEEKGWVSLPHAPLQNNTALMHERPYEPPIHLHL